jgi:hypothetical protein
MCARVFFKKFCKCLHARTLDFRIFLKPFINLFKIQVVDIWNQYSTNK